MTPPLRTRPISLTPVIRRNQAGYPPSGAEVTALCNAVEHLLAVEAFADRVRWRHHSWGATTQELAFKVCLACQGIDPAGYDGLEAAGRLRGNPQMVGRRGHTAACPLAYLDA